MEQRERGKGGEAEMGDAARPHSLDQP
jgi:hypothetical protein